MGPYNTRTFHLFTLHIHSGALADSPSLNPQLFWNLNITFTNIKHYEQSRYAVVRNVSPPSDNFPASCSLERMLKSVSRAVPCAESRSTNSSAHIFVMRTRAALIMNDWDEAAKANRIAWQPSWPRATRKCATIKNYAEPDSDLEEDYETHTSSPSPKRTKNQGHSQPNKKARYVEDSDDDLIIDEERSTPAPIVQVQVLQKTRPSKIVRLPLTKTLHRKLRAAKLFKLMPTEVRRLLNSWFELHLAMQTIRIL